MSEQPISALFLAVTAWLDHYGHVPTGPEPQMLEVSGPDGIHISLNRTANELQGIPPFAMKLVRLGWPVAVLNPYGGACIGMSESALIAIFEETVP